MNRLKKIMLDKIKRGEISHDKRIHGWTGQDSYCGFATWWDCNFFCTNPKLNHKMGLLSCRCVCTPDFNKCKRLRRKLK